MPSENGCPPEPAPGLIELGPPSVIVIAKIIDIGGLGHDGHGLGGGDVVGVCGAEGGIDRAVGVGIIDHMQLGAVHLGGKLRPPTAQRIQRQASAVDQIGHAVHRLAQLACERWIMTASRSE